ncbi:dihydroorotate dehydrogenase [Gephyromycinifex aptenodytis]|uniref:dihydroorotate dehydrogenase n=1 Tax=Gephyromycinifex aptenodytis TaxID=2716227 RepID=UPI001D001FFE|nr:dihydroorotate dehydrogenase [Gephyromycinifex aptenodytis]
MFSWLKGEKVRESEAADWDDAARAPQKPAPSGHTAAADADARPARTALMVSQPEPAQDIEVDLQVELAGMRLPNPVMTASGCAANGRELNRFFDVAQLGAFVTKTVMAAPRSGRGTPRMAETPSGMLNSIGLQGPGIESFVETDLAWLKQAGARVLVSIAGGDAREFAYVARVLRECDAADAVAGVEVNISCPNVANRGLVFSCDPASSAEVVSAVAGELPAGIPAFAKLTADVTDIVQIARAALEAGAHGLTMINTLLGIKIDTRTMRPHLGGITGGLSGPAIRPVAVRAVWQVKAAMLAGALPDAPIIGVGGIRTGEDALEFIAAGASGLQVGTSTFNDPSAPIRVRDELSRALAVRGIDSLAHVVGAAHGEGR